MRFKRYLWMATLLVGIAAAAQVQADDSAALKERIAAFSSFEAQFSQKVTKNGTTEVSASKGIISIAQPDKLMMHTVDPDEQVLFTRGGDVYFYDPAVNQVTIYPNSKLAKSPFWLLSSSGEQLWREYKVSRKGNVFTLVPVRQNEFRSLDLAYEGKNLVRISLKMRDGSVNTYELFGQRAENTQGIFDYSLPSDVEVDDER